MSRSFTLSMTLTTLLLFIGCGRGTPDETAQSAVNRPASVAAGVTKLNEFRDAIKTAFDAGTPEDCDAALHEAFDLVEALPDVAAEEGLSTEAIDTVKAAAEDLKNHFMKIHEGSHGPGMDNDSYSSVADAIDQAIASLAELAN